ncbi:Galactose mutarotase [Carnobacterium iners]|uniref:Galactose mutarotase n=1 Tax=Carnobacterium iners TaxID=1073423 RepID=A0A1X7N0E2_9LACT|nr:aldose 1-epimerase family protein [Carnobacterium iners]SEK20343.1 Galactose mutarotase [Carnobacterium iners]SMH30254.1 Galactose mutarotase [Carnobacterium iners]
MITIENEYLTVVIKEKGAELAKVYNKVDAFDYLWTGNSQYWGRQAPILFPIIGKLNEDAYTIGEKEYTMSQHGFAREFDFELVSQSDKQALFSLSANEQTKKMYPFDFKLQITYLLEEKNLAVHYSVENLSETIKLPFSLGAHPGFNIPLNNDGVFSDYQLTFEPALKNSVNVLEIDDGPFPFITGNNKELALTKENVLELDYQTFDNGLLIIDENVASVTLSSPLSKNSITLEVSEFPYLTLWTVENKKAPFLCIEPFYGLPDQIGKIGDLYDKKGNCILATSDTKKMTFSMTFK